MVYSSYSKADCQITSSFSISKISTYKNEALNLHVQVGKFEVEVMRKASSEEVLSGALYLANKAPQPIPTQLPALTMKKQTFKSVKPGGSQQSR